MATTPGSYLYGLIRTTVESEVGKGSTFRVELPVGNHTISETIRSVAG